MTGKERVGCSIASCTKTAMTGAVLVITIGLVVVLLSSKSVSNGPFVASALASVSTIVNAVSRYLDSTKEVRSNQKRAKGNAHHTLRR